MGDGQAEFVVWREIPVARKCERAGSLAVCAEVGQGLVVVVFPNNQCFVVLDGSFLFFHAYAAFKREVVPVCLFYTEKAVMAHIVVNQHRLLDGFGNGGKRAGFLSQILHAPAAFQTACRVETINPAGFLPRFISHCADSSTIKEQGGRSRLFHRRISMRYLRCRGVPMDSLR